MPKKRKDCFFGIHFDFHAMPDEVVARHFDPDVFCEMLDRVKPDYMQFDTKGHAGFSSYPTACGNQAKEIQADVLRFLRRETAKRDVALFAHHSGLYDRQVIKQHPDWACVDAQGVSHVSYLSPFSPYVDQVLIPQMKELALDYQLDGVWVDGDCWACPVDYSSWTVQAYGKPAPKPDEDGYEEYCQFCRQGFYRYVNHYIEELKAVAPEFEITSNWIFSPHTTEALCAPVDFLSGDFSCSDSVVSGRHNGRYFASRGLPWDLMSWGHSAYPLSWETHNRTTKGAVQYMQEAASVLSMGGGYQFFNIAYCGGGYIQRWALPIWEKTAEFCRQRQICHKSTLWSTMAVVVPDRPAVSESGGLFPAHSDSMDRYYAWMDALCESGYSPNVILESELDNTDVSGYELLVLPMETRLPKDYDGIIIKDGTGPLKLVWLSDGERLAAMRVGVGEYEGEPFGELRSENYFEHDSVAQPSAMKVGKTYQLCFDFASAYRENVSTVIRNWLRSLIADTGIRVPVTVEGSSFVELITARKGNDLYVNLVNMCGDHRRSEVRCSDEIPPLYHITVRVGDQVRTVERLDIHELLIFPDYFA